MEKICKNQRSKGGLAAHIYVPAGNWDKLSFGSLVNLCEGGQGNGF